MTTDYEAQKHIAALERLGFDVRATLRSPPKPPVPRPLGSRPPGLSEYSPVREWDCRICGRHQRDNFKWDTELRLYLQDNHCFLCAFWLHRVNDKDLLKRSVRVDGVGYCLPSGPLIRKGAPFWDLGFAGRWWTIQFRDGRVVRTNSLWHSGEIPLAFRHKLLDNAEFLTESPEDWARATGWREMK